MGVGAGTGYLPDYPAAGQGRVRTLALPNFRYRGKVLRADEDSGVRARIFENENVDFDLSFGGAFPVNAGDNRARKDMAPLNWLVEFGPRLFVILYNNPKKARLRFGLPMRAVYSTDGKSATYRGIVTVPGFLGELFHSPCDRCRMIAAIGPTFASEGVGDYFYQVDQKDVTANRPFYDAKPGYMGTDFTAGLSYTQAQWEIFIGGRASTYAGAVNERSPLFIRRENVAGFIAVGWLFYSSKEEAKQ
ncbi:MAG: MipA/OmpV family protein [Bacteriovoracaceae bacterium]|nr:MipA/OmpV family protein [Bacteriovoracaceae bacterium]